MSKWVVGRVIKLKKWTSVLFSITLHAPISPFIAGQFAKLALEINGIRVQRAYSYVNAPSSPNLEFYLVNVPQGKLSSRLATLSPGKEVMITKEASGFLVLEGVPTCESLWMLATGTAIGPFLSILQESTGVGRFKNIVLVYAARFFNDLSYLALIKKLCQNYRGKLRIQTVISREVTKNSLNGRIPTLIENGILEASLGLNIDARTSHVMLCGNPDMVRDTQKILQEKHKMRKHFKHKIGHITSENYW